MKKQIYLNFQFIKFIWIFLVIAGFSCAAFGATFTVTKIADTNDTVCNTDCSLREAIVAVNAAATDDIINFDLTVFGTPQTIILGGTSLDIENNGSLIINGTGTNLLTVSGNIQSRAFNIGVGAILQSMV